MEETHDTQLLDRGENLKTIKREKRKKKLFLFGYIYNTWCVHTAKNTEGQNRGTPSI